MLAAIRSLLADDAEVFVVDELVADTFGAPADESERLAYAFAPVAWLRFRSPQPQPAQMGRAWRAGRC